MRVTVPGAPSLPCAALLLLASAAWATPATPPPLEALVHDTPLILVARLKTRPAFVGDVYEIEVEETLKGQAPAAPVHVAAPDYFRGCCIQLNAPPAPAREAEAKRVLLFIRENRVRKLVILDPEEGMSAWFGYGHGARYGPSAVRALLEIDAADAEHAAALWVGGLRGPNPLLVDALLDRMTAGPDLGSDLAERARRDLNAGRPDIVAAVVDLCESRFLSTRQRALECARRALPLDPPLLRKALAAARASAPCDDRWTREASLRLLIEGDHTAALDAVIAALRRDDGDQYAHDTSIDLARDLAKRRPEAFDAIVAMLVATLDEDSRAIVALRRITGEKFVRAAEWKEWWVSRRR